MGRQLHLHGLVDVPPFRVVIHLLSDQRGTRHEAECLVEILEDKGLPDRLATPDLGPARYGVKCLLACLRRQSLCHDRLHRSGELYPNTVRTTGFMRGFVHPLTMTEM